MFPEDAIREANIHRRQFRRIIDAVKPLEIIHGHYHREYFTDRADLGYGPLRVVGLDCDGAWEMNRNVYVRNISMLRARNSL